MTRVPGEVACGAATLAQSMSERLLARAVLPGAAAGSPANRPRLVD